MSLLNNLIYLKVYSSIDLHLKGLLPLSGHGPYALEMFMMHYSHTDLHACLFYSCSMYMQIVTVVVQWQGKEVSITWPTFDTFVSGPRGQMVSMKCYTKYSGSVSTKMFKMRMIIIIIKLCLNPGGNQFCLK